jgi:hypothetical protein
MKKVDRVSTSYTLIVGSNFRGFLSAVASSSRFAALIS